MTPKPLIKPVKTVQTDSKSSTESTHRRKTVPSPRPAPEVVLHASSTTQSSPMSSRPLPEPVSHSEAVVNVLSDILWFCCLIAVLFLMLSLISFYMEDPAWSRSIPWDVDIHNLAGGWGAYIADIHYYLFGFSAWWLVFAILLFLWKNFRPLKRYAVQSYRYWLGTISLLVLLLCSAIGEDILWQHHFDEYLPVGAGGLIGMMFGGAVEHVLGREVAVVLMSVISLVAIFFLTQVAWKQLFQQIKYAGVYLVKQLSNKRKSTKHFHQREIEEAKNITAMPIEQSVVTSSNREKVQSHKDFVEDTIFILERDPEPVVEVFLPENYQKPDLSLLNMPNEVAQTVTPEMLQMMAEKIEQVLADLELEATVVNAVAGPVIIAFEIVLGRATKSMHVMHNMAQIADLLEEPHLRIAEVLQNEQHMRFEMPNAKRQRVYLQEIIASAAFQKSTSPLTVALGKDILGGAVVADLIKMPNLLIAGKPLSGKTTNLHGLILSILFRATPYEVRMIMLDSMHHESLNVYSTLPHLLCPVTTHHVESMNAVHWCVAELDRRRSLLQYFALANRDEYHQKLAEAKADGRQLLNPFSRNPDHPKPLDDWPMIVLVINELADLLKGRDKPLLEQDLLEMAKYGRMVGIHFIATTAQPSLDSLVGELKNNMPTRMAFTMDNTIDSRMILDQLGAEDLLMDGDFLLKCKGFAMPIRLQSAWVSEQEVQKVVDCIVQQTSSNYLNGLLSGEAAAEIMNALTPNEDTDPLFDKALSLVIEEQRVTVSLLMRCLNVGYNRAETLIEALEESGVVSKKDVNGRRSVLFTQQ